MFARQPSIGADTRFYVGSPPRLRLYLLQDFTRPTNCSCSDALSDCLAKCHEVSLTRVSQSQKLHSF